MLNSEIIDRAIMIDKRIKEDKKELDALKSLLQTSALAEMENKNLKHIEYFGKYGSVVVTYKEAVEVDNYKILSGIVDTSILDKIKREESINFKIDDKAKKVLVALYKKDYAEHDIEAILLGLGLDKKAIKLLNKKLKGDYVKDKQLLESFGLDVNLLEEELDAIREQRNYELITKFFDDPKQVDVKELGRALSIEESISIGLQYEKEVVDEKNN